MRSKSGLTLFRDVGRLRSLPPISTGAGVLLPWGASSAAFTPGRQRLGLRCGLAKPLRFFHGRELLAELALFAMDFG